MTLEFSRDSIRQEIANRASELKKREDRKGTDFYVPLRLDLR